MNEQEVTDAAASVALHCTGVVPTGKSEPDVREQLTAMGARPPVVVGFGNVTATGAPLLDEADTGAGHVMLNVAGSGGRGSG